MPAPQIHRLGSEADVDVRVASQHARAEADTKFAVLIAIAEKVRGRP